MYSKSHEDNQNNFLRKNERREKKIALKKE